MALSRFSFSTKKRDINGEEYISNSKASYRVYKAIEAGLLEYETRILEEGERLDHIAGAVYDNANYWWIIAAASGIGWGLQVPAGTYIRIPRNISEVFGVLS